VLRPCDIAIAVTADTTICTPFVSHLLKVSVGDAWSDADSDAPGVWSDYRTVYVGKLPHEGEGIGEGPRVWARIEAFGVGMRRALEGGMTDSRKLDALFPWIRICRATNVYDRSSARAAFNAASNAYYDAHAILANGRFSTMFAVWVHVDELTEIERAIVARMDASNEGEAK
jgi:hypothetical protein